MYGCKTGNYEHKSPDNVSMYGHFEDQIDEHVAEYVKKELSETPLDPTVEETACSPSHHP